MKTPRFVWVDIGYGPAANITKVKVISEETRMDLFDSTKTKTSLLVELPDKTRIYVDQWAEEL